MQLGCVPPVDTYPTGQLQVQPPPETVHVPPLPHGYGTGLAGLHPLTHEIPLNKNPALHEQVYPAPRLVHVAAASPPKLQGFEVQSFGAELAQLFEQQSELFTQAAPTAAQGMVVVVVVVVLVVVVGGGARSVFTSATNASTLPSIADWSPAGATQSFADSAFADAALYFASHASSFVESTGAFLSAAFP
jgi:hypothetical protein